MKKTLSLIFVFAVTVFGSLRLGAEPDWQIHARWCTTDKGSSHGAYMTTCANYDQFDSVIACQTDAHNGDAVAAIQSAGRATVDAYMDNYKPKECR